MKKKLLIIIPIVIILILLLLFFFRFQVYTVKVIDVTDNKIYAEPIKETDFNYFFYKEDLLTLGTDISNIKEGDTIRIWSITHFRTRDDLLSRFHNGKYCEKIVGFKIIRVLQKADEN